MGVESRENGGADARRRARTLLSRSLAERAAEMGGEQLEGLWDCKEFSEMGDLCNGRMLVCQRE